ncbi:MAG: hypothetical protein EXR79_16045 [Myxococcales bacterium]|nr:hypothetical protein [Myxococcales bacterium]
MASSLARPGRFVWTNPETGIQGCGRTGALAPSARLRPTVAAPVIFSAQLSQAQSNDSGAP